MIIKVKQYQTIWDIALQYAGSLEAAMDILEANGKTSTELLNGEELLIPKIYSKKIQQFFNSENVNIASSVLPLGDDGYVEPTLPFVCEPVNISVFDNPFLILNSGTAANIKVLKQNLENVPIIETDGENIIVEWPELVECPTLAEVIQDNTWAAIFPHLSDQQLFDARVDYEVKYANGTPIDSGYRTPGEDLIVEVVNPVVPSGIAYFEPNDFAHPLPQFELYDSGWRVANGLFKASKPSYPLYNQTLDLSAANPDITLLYNNVHGTKNRYTRVDGTTTTVTTNNVPIRDHLTRREWIALSISSSNFVALLAAAYAAGYFLPSQAEFMSVRNNNVGTVSMLGRTMIPSGQGQAFGTTDPTNTANYLGSNNSQVPFSSYLKTNNRPTTLLCKIW